MPAPRPFPVYPKQPLKHSGGARIKIGGRAFYLGKHGSEKSYREYERIRAEHAIKGAAPTPKLAADDALTIAELIAAWMTADPRGPKHREVIGIARACTPLRRMFGQTPAAEFTSLRLIALQEAMLTASWMTDEERKKARNAKPWSGRYIAKQHKRMLRIFRWGEANGVLPKGTWENLKSVVPIRATDCRARVLPDRETVDWQSQVVPVLAVVSRQVAALIRLQYLGGMRPQDAVKMRPCDLDPNGPGGCWLYRPDGHKGEWRGHELVKVLGTAALAVLRPWLDLVESDDAFLFPPHKRLHGQHISTEAYARAVTDACKRAGVKPWSPGLLRHAAAMEARRIGGDGAVKAFLGHESLATGKHYAKEQDLQTAARVANAIR